jgi:hypothetical protein
VVTTAAMSVQPLALWRTWRIVFIVCGASVVTVQRVQVTAVHVVLVARVMHLRLFFALVPTAAFAFASSGSLHAEIALPAHDLAGAPERQCLAAAVIVDECVCDAPRVV